MSMAMGALQNDSDYVLYIYKGSQYKTQSRTQTDLCTET